MESNGIDIKSIIGIEQELNQIQDMDVLLERILLEARKVAHADAGSIYIWERKAREPERGHLSIKYAQNDTLRKALPPGQKSIYSVFSVAIDDKTISGYCALTREPVNVPDVYHLDPGAPYSFSTAYDLQAGYKTQSVLAIPLETADNRLLGVIQMINARNEAGETVPFSRENELLVTHFAASATAVLQRVSITRAMILRMIKMAELRDPKETGAHTNRVAGYAAEIYDCWAYHQGIPLVERERFRDSLKVAALLHDVGKVAISDLILKKPGRFTPEEYLVMQHHTTYGALLFEDPQASIDIMSRDIALTHHENWDGTGYPGWVNPATGEVERAGPDGKPLGKKGAEIPLTGRIVAVADVFDALSSRRVYKEAWEEEQVLNEIRQLSGTKFEPALVEVFFKILPTIKQIQSLYPEET